MAVASKDMPERKRACYSAEYRAKASALTQQISVAAAATDLGLHATQIYQWRAEAAPEKSISDRKRQLRKEDARLMRPLANNTEEVAILGEITAYFTKKLD
jgi:transposase